MSYIPIVTAGVFLLLLLLERIDPLRQAKNWWIGRLAINFCVTALAFGVNATMVQPAASFMLQWTQHQTFGLIHLVELPVWVQGAIAFLLMDLTFYYWHRATHRFPLLWRFHNVHHIDPDLDVSTGFRFHFIEIAFSTGFRVLQVALIGVSAGVYAIYELVFQVNTLFHHSNVKLPLWLERWLNLVLVTPRMHGIHHSQVQQETNSNYSVVFPWWDRLHRTLRLNIPHSEITIGIPAYSDSQDNKIQHLFLMPFQQQRDYWHSADGTTVERNPAVLGEDMTRMVDNEDISVQQRDRACKLQLKSQR